MKYLIFTAAILVSLSGFSQRLDSAAYVKRSQVNIQLFGSAIIGNIGYQHLFSKHFAYSINGIVIPLSDRSIGCITLGVNYLYKPDRKVFGSLEAGGGYYFDRETSLFNATSKLDNGRAYINIGAFIQPALNFKLGEKYRIAIQFTQFIRLYWFDSEYPDGSILSPISAPGMFGSFRQLGGIKISKIIGSSGFKKHSD